jgi:SAM-dependent MidA family methyltransferase
VRLIRFSSGQWHERFITQTQNHLDWIDQPASTKLLNEINRWSIPPIEGFTTEIRPGVSSWLKLLSEKIHQGAILTLDYGFPAHELYHPSRFAGTLHALRQHASSANPLADPGQQDLTAHVNFTELIEEGKKVGFQSHGPLPFMTALPRQATPLLIENPPMSNKLTRNFQHLVHPSFFGQSHLALLQSKNLPESYQPSMFLS